MNINRILFIAGRITNQVNRFLIAEMKKRHIEGIAPSHGEILGSLMFRGPLSMKDIAGIIDKDKSTITSLVNKLIGLGYVNRNNDPNDSRISIISLTEKGKSLKPFFVELSALMREKAFRNFSEKEKKTLNELLEKLYGNL